MSNIALDYTGQTGDLEVVGHRIGLVTGERAIEQNLRVRLRFFLEEWFLDQRQGIPYFREVFIKNPNLLLLQSIFRTAILETTGISNVNTLTVELDKASRTLSLFFVATMDTGATLTYSPFVIEI